MQIRVRQFILGGRLPSFAIILGVLGTAAVVPFALISAPVPNVLSQIGTDLGISAHDLQHFVQASLIGLVLSLLGLLLIRQRLREARRLSGSLSRALRRYRRAIEAARCGVYYWDAFNGRVHFDDRLRKLFGVGGREFVLTGRLWIERLHPDDKHEFLIRFRRFLKGEDKEFCHEYRTVLPDGRVIWLRDRSSAERDCNGRVVSAVGTFEDITERRAAELDSEANAERIEAFTTLAADLVWETDAEFRITFAEGRIADYFGSLEKAPIGRNQFEIMRELGLETDSQRLQAHRDVLLRRETFRDIHFSYQDEQGGRRWVCSSGAPRYDNQGRFAGYRGILREITNVVEAETATRKHKERFEAIVENAPMPILFKDLDGTITHVNPKTVEQMGVPRSALVGKHVSEFNPPEISAAIQAHESEVIRTGQAVTREIRQTTPHGVLDLMSTKFPLRDPAGAMTRIGVLSFDITDLRIKEAALEKSEARFRDFAHSASDWFWETDTDHRFAYIGAKFEADTGLPPNVAIGKTREEWVGSEAISREPEKWASLRAKFDRREPFRDFQYEFTAEDGRQVTVEISGRPFFDNNGLFLGYRGCSRDVTERREMEVSLREREEFLERITDNLPIWISYVDADLRYRFVNAQFAKELKVPKGELIGKRMGDFHPMANGPTVRPYLQEALRGKPVSVELELQRVGGGTAWYQYNFVPRVLNGTTEGIFILRQDITALREAERSARERAQHLQTIADGGPALIAYLDPDGRYEFVNRTAQEWYARPAEEIVGKGVEEILGSEFMEMFRPHLESTLAGNTSRFTGHVSYPDGKKRFIEASWQPDIEDGRVKGLHGFVVDLTRLKELEEQIRQSQKMEAIGQLTGGIAHDFNNLLLAIQTNLDLVEMQSAGELEPQLRGACSAVERAADLTRRLLAFSRRQELEPCDIDLGNFFPEFATLLQRTLRGDIEVVIPPADPHLAISADPGQLENALLNLAINARDAMPIGGKLIFEIDRAQPCSKSCNSMEAAERARFVRIRVTDTGMGMSEEAVQKAFEPFFTTKEKGRGTGLGLSMVHGFIKQSGGSIQIDSVVGDGTTVTLYLPEAELPVSTVARRRRNLCQVGGGTILLVEDDDLVREATEQTLVQLGYDVVAVESAKSAMEILDERSDFVLVFSDVVMPGGCNGLELANYVRQHKPSLAFLLTSGYPDKALEATETSGNRFEMLQKPYSSAVLSEAIVRAINGHRAG